MSRRESGCRSCGDFKKDDDKKHEKKHDDKKDVHDHGCRKCQEQRAPRCPEKDCEGHKKRKHHDCRECPKPREDCEEIETVRIGVFDASQPNDDIVELGDCERVVGFDAELAWEIYHNRLGYCVEFYSVPVTNVGLNQLTCGLIDVVASSTVNITSARLAVANYIAIDAAVPGPLAAIVPASVGCSGDTTLRNLWLAVGGPAGINGCPTQANFRIARNSLGTVQSNALRAALSAAYPNCSQANLDAYYLQQTVDVRAFTCAEIVAGFNTLYQAAVIGPRGDIVQTQVIFDELDALFPGQFVLCPNVATVPASVRGWAIRSCKLALETQAALDEIVCDGTYASLVAQAASFPLFTEECLLAGAGETFLLPPPRSLFSITSGFIDTACLACLCKLCLREVKCPCEKPLVRPHALAGSIQCDIAFDCCACECETQECDDC